MTSKTGIRVGRPFLVTTMLLRNPCPNPRAKIDASFRATLRIARKTGLELRGGFLLRTSKGASGGVSFPRSALSLSLEFDIATLLRRLGFKPDDPRQGSFGPVELSQPQGAQERSRRRNAAPFVLPLVRTSENDRKRRARGRPPRHTVADVGCVRVLC